MSRYIATLTAAFAALLIVSAHAGTTASPAYQEGELLVRLSPGITPQRAAAFLSRRGLKVSKAYPALSAALNGQVLHVITDRPAVEAMARLLNQRGFAQVSLNGIRKPSLLPNDQHFAKVWGLYNEGQTGGRVGADIDASAAWDVTTGSEGVVVAVVDTGVDYTHEDLRDNMWRNPGEIPGNGVDDDGNGYIDDVVGYDFAGTLRGANDSDPMDSNGHGTHCSGIIGATGNNGIGISGVNWDVSIMAIKAARPPLFSFVDSDLLEAMEYILMMKRDYNINIVAVNASYGGPGANALAGEAIDALGKAGIIFCAASGNETQDLDRTPSYPASYPVDTIITVGATDHNDALTDFSNYGRSSVDIAAPGQGILSTVPDGLGTLSAIDSESGALNARNYDVYDGTSMATPYVAGAVALVAAAHPADDVNLRIARILKGVDVLPGLSGAIRTSGRLNVAQAINISLTPPTPSITANGQQGLLVVSPGTPINASVSLQPGTLGSDTVEYWVTAQTPTASYYFKPPNWRTAVQAAATAPLQQVDGVSILSQRSLPQGVYTLRFGIDDEVDGTYAPDWETTMEIRIQP